QPHLHSFPTRRSSDLTAIAKPKHLPKMEVLQKEKIVFIFDECHRSQFGDTHNKIKAFFQNSQMFGFTGTPIFADNSVKNALGKRDRKSTRLNSSHVKI